MADDTTVPEGYELCEDESAHEPEVGLLGSAWYAYPIALRGAFASKVEAIAACHQHRNRIAAEALREAAAKCRDLPVSYFDHGDGEWLVARVECITKATLLALADTLDPPKETP